MSADLINRATQAVELTQKAVQTTYGQRQARAGMSNSSTVTARWKKYRTRPPVVWRCRSMRAVVTRVIGPQI